jgi:hypothetical protein
MIMDDSFNQCDRNVSQSEEVLHASRISVVVV